MNISQKTIELWRHRANFHEEDGAVRWEQYQSITRREVRSDVYGICLLQWITKEVSATDKPTLRSVGTKRPHATGNHSLLEHEAQEREAPLHICVFH